MIIDIESRINEAEVCRSMGLYGDSLNIYESILPIVPPQDAQVQDTIKKRINLLKKEIADLEETKPKGVSAREISMFKKTLSSEGDVTEILDSASAFQEMGLYNEAVAEYEKLFKKDYPADDVIAKMTGAKPRGWRAPLYNFSDNSADLLIERGFSYDASLMGDDVPYVLKTDKGELIELSSHWGLDDWPHNSGGVGPRQAPVGARKTH